MYECLTHPAINSHGVILHCDNAAIVDARTFSRNLLVNLRAFARQHLIQDSFGFLYVSIEQLNLVNIEGVVAHLGQHQSPKGFLQVLRKFYLWLAHRLFILRCNRRAD